ncbi:MAG: DNA-binding protein [Thermoprotei archaeon]|nr:MAG: DNA-binding protein [Thermoprotei archaeon]
MENSFYYDKELEEIKRRKLLEYQKALEEAKAKEIQKAQEEAKKQAILAKILTPKARRRLANLRLVKPELVEIVEIQLIQLAQSGRIPLPIDDDLLKRLLIEITNRTRKEIKIKF